MRPSIPFAVSDAGWLEGALLQLVDREPGDALFTIIALATAAGIGAGHALGPGHGKVLIGAYLVGAQGRGRDAVALGGAIGLMHTGSVLALGLLLYTVQWAGGDRLESVLTVASATAVTAVGAVLLRGRLRRLVEDRRTAALVAAGRDRVASAQHHDHHDHHDHGHHHHPVLDGAAPLSTAGLVALASSGGLLPSPSAVLVLAASMSIDRTGFGLALVAAFSIGLAATLTLIGAAVVVGRQELQRRAPHRRILGQLAQAVPVVGAAAVLAGGLLLAASAVLRW